MLGVSFLLRESSFEVSLCNLLKNLLQPCLRGLHPLARSYVVWLFALKLFYLKETHWFSKYLEEVSFTPLTRLYTS